jgi:hypothetical protein
MRQLGINPELDEKMFAFKDEYSPTPRSAAPSAFIFW